MSFVAFPLRVEGGRLARFRGAWRSVRSLLKMMANTSGSGWRGSPHFGLREALAESRHKPDERSATVKQMNRALEDLGVDWLTVKELQPNPFDPASGVVSYDLTVVVHGGTPRTIRLSPDAPDAPDDDDDGIV
jgi:hypothetical protein